MPKSRIQKQEKVTELTEKLARAKSVVLADYQGLTMAQLTELRGRLESLGAEFQVTKNNLLSLALKESGLKSSNSEITGPTATLFGFEDEISPIKVLVKTLKEFEKGRVFDGFLEKQELSEAEVVRLAELPSKDELCAKVVGSLGAPLYGIVRVLQANIRNLVYVLEAYRGRQTT